jgi:transcriptional regulator with XRE-family HTH domain
VQVISTAVETATAASGEFIAATPKPAEKSPYLRYENKNVQPPANIMNLLAEHLGTSVDYLINGDKTEKAKATIKNADLLQKFKEVDALPEDEQNVIVKVISAYVRDFRAKQAYAS